MRSKTKYEISREELDAIFDNAKFGKVKSFEPLGDGMYNAVYKVLTEDKTYAIKIAPLPQVKVMTYEKDMLNTEVYWYKMMAKKTNINVPQVYAVDVTRKIIPSDYFIMDYLEGQTVNKLKKSAEEAEYAKRSLCENVAQLHSIDSDKFGYVQNGLYDNWYDALRSFVVNCLQDLKAVGKKSKRGKKLLAAVDKYKEILKAVKGSLVNFDAWDLNIMATRTESGLKLTWIDPERGFYGDPIFDFICIDLKKMSLQKKQTSLDLYNSFATTKLSANRESEIRFAFSLGYMALIQETEKFYRYRPVDFGWWFDVISSGMYYNRCFKLLKDNSKKC